MLKRTQKSIIPALLTLVFLAGCASTQKQAQSIDPVQKELLALKKENRILKDENDLLRDQLKGVDSAKSEQISELERAKLELEKKLKNEISDYKAKLEMTERGLVITFLAEIFFDSGKAEIRDTAMPTLNEVGKVLKEKLSNHYIAVEGHTDNVPIKHSGWTSNWELASARALSVLHYFVDKCKVSPDILSGDSYGEFRPVATNQTPEGRQQNRRVEIVILPPNIKKISD